MKTYPRVIELLKEDSDKTSTNRVAAKTDLTHNTVTGYMKGKVEPTQTSLEKIGKAYGRTVAWLRGEPETGELVDISGLSAPKRKLWDCIKTLSDEKAKALLEILE